MPESPPGLTPGHDRLRLYCLDCFRYWHETDMPTALRNVRYRRQSRKHLPALSFSGFDPSRKSSTPFAVTYEAATLPSGRAKLLSSG